MRQITLFAFGWLALLASVQAASFDCGKAETKIEHLICDNVDLSKLDDELGSAYQDALLDETHAQNTKQDQKKWIHSRNICADPACLKQSYEVRIAQLSLGMKDGLVEGNENSLCHRTDLDDMKHVDYNLLHGLEKYTPGKVVDDGMAKVDIENVGHPDNLVRVTFSGAGGCEAKVLQVLDDSRTSISESKVNRMLGELGLCNSNQDAFIFENLVYVDLKDQDNTRSIYLIRDAKAKLICKFQNFTSFSEGNDQ